MILAVYTRSLFDPIPSDRRSSLFGLVAFSTTNRCPLRRKMLWIAFRSDSIGSALQPFWFSRIFCDEPVSTSSENALKKIPLYVVVPTHSFMSTGRRRPRASFQSTIRYIGIILRIAENMVSVRALPHFGPPQPPCPKGRTASCNRVLCRVFPRASPQTGLAALAQLVEHIIRNDGVACSSHASGTKNFKGLGTALRCEKRALR